MLLSCIVILLLSYSCIGIDATAIPDQDGDPNTQNDDIQITYTLWIGTEIEREYSIDLSVAPNTSFFNVMEVASQLNPTFNFEAQDFPELGHFITEIAGVANDVTNSTFWMIYILPTRPSKDSPPTDEYLSPVGVDNIGVQENKYYLFWYRYVVIEDIFD